jgi:hypothetical protein
MKRALFATLLGVCTVPTFAGDIGVSITVGQPGFYGQIDIGNTPRPPVVYEQPVVIARAPEYASAPPIYLHVPPGHEKHWNKHCAEYHACGRPVYFVRDDWYNNEYVPQHRHHDDEGGDHDHGHGNDHHKDHDHDHDHDRDHDRGN